MALGYYSKKKPVPGERKVAKPRTVRRVPLSRDEIAFVKKRTGLVDGDAKQRFVEAYNSWKRDWQHPSILVSSDPGDRRYSPYYREIVGLGPEVVPLLLERLLNHLDDEFFALQAVDQLLPSALVVSYDLEDEAVWSGEQGRAVETIRRWVSFNG